MKKNYKKPQMEAHTVRVTTEMMAQSWNSGQGNIPENQSWHNGKTNEENNWEEF